MCKPSRLVLWISRCNLSVMISLIAMGVAGCARSGDGLIKYPVEGTVLIDGEPSADLIVRLIAKEASPAGANARFPVGVTDDIGVFRISTNGESDGAVAGQYYVTIVWPESNEPPLRDRLHGAYSTPEKSKLQVTVQEGPNILEPFELTTPKLDGRRIRRTREEDEE